MEYNFQINLKQLYFPTVFKITALLYIDKYLIYNT